MIVTVDMDYFTEPYVGLAQPGARPLWTTLALSQPRATSTGFTLLWSWKQNPTSKRYHFSGIFQR
jgi:hypothetical protein